MHVVTKDDVESSRYTIFDVVIPLPGSEITWPTHAAGKAYYLEMLGKDGFSEENDPFLSAAKMLRLRGDYRLLVQQAKNVNFKMVEYTNPNVSAGGNVRFGGE